MFRTLLLLTTLAVGDCRHAADPQPQVSPSVPPPAQVIFQPSRRPDAPVATWLATDEPQREKGLMYVRQMPADDGMLFVFDADDVQTFWMKNTYIPLDMIFIDVNKTVVGVVEDAEPMTLTNRTVGKPSRYVLEVNAGWARNHGVAEGTPCIIKE